MRYAKATKRRAPRAIICAALAAGLCAAYVCAGAVEKGYTVFHGDRTLPRVAITVDDCYDTDNVEDILELCEEHGVKVTFFVVGSALNSSDKQLWQRAIDTGHELGNHTWSHARLPELSRSGILRQLEKTESRLNELLGCDYDMQVMRPPYGDLSSKPNLMSEIWVVETIEKAGYLHAVRWDVSQTDPDKAIGDVQNGSILLYHANPKDVRCLRKLIPAILSEGYECVTVSELLGLTPAN